jgi:hypothetical protein
MHVGNRQLMTTDNTLAWNCRKEQQPLVKPNASPFLLTEYFQ